MNRDSWWLEKLMRRRIESWVLGLIIKVSKKGNGKKLSLKNDNKRRKKSENCWEKDIVSNYRNLEGLLEERKKLYFKEIINFNFVNKLNIWSEFNLLLLNLKFFNDTIYFHRIKLLQITLSSFQREKWS